MVMWMHPASLIAGKNGVSRKQMNLHSGGHLSVQQQVNMGGWLRSRAGTVWWRKVWERHLSLPASQQQAHLYTAACRGLAGIWVLPWLWGCGAAQGVEGDLPLHQGAATGARVPSAPLWGLGWMLVARLSAWPPHTDPPGIPSGSARDFFHCSKEAELIEQYSSGQHRSFLKFLVLVFLKLCILRHETQHPLAPEAFP